MPVKNNPRGKSSPSEPEVVVSQPTPFDPEKDANVTVAKVKSEPTLEDIQAAINPGPDAPEESMPVAKVSEIPPDGHDAGNAIVIIEKPMYHLRLGHKLSKPQRVTVNNRDWVSSLKFWKDLDFIIRDVVYLPAGWKQPDAKMVVPD